MPLALSLLRRAFCQTAQPMGTVEVSFWFPVVWGCSCLCCTSWARQTQGGGAQESATLRRPWELQPSKYWQGQLNKGREQPFLSYCLCKKKNPGHQSATGFMSQQYINSCFACTVIPGVAWIVGHRRWPELRGHSDFVSPLRMNQTGESLPTDMTSWQQAPRPSSFWKGLMFEQIALCQETKDD